MLYHLSSVPKLGLSMARSDPIFCETNFFHLILPESLFPKLTVRGLHRKTKERKLRKILSDYQVLAFSLCKKTTLWELILMGRVDYYILLSLLLFVWTIGRTVYLHINKDNTKISLLVKVILFFDHIISICVQLLDFINSIFCNFKETW